MTSVFVLKGEDVLLEVPNPDFLKLRYYFTWTFKNQNIVLMLYNRRQIVTDIYTGRVDFSTENYSLTVKNLQESDSGLYTAVLTGEKEQIVAEYQVTVQGQCLHVSDFDRELHLLPRL